MLDSVRYPDPIWLPNPPPPLPPLPPLPVQDACKVVPCIPSKARLCADCRGGVVPFPTSSRASKCLVEQPGFVPEEEWERWNPPEVEPEVAATADAVSEATAAEEAAAAVAAAAAVRVGSAFNQWPASMPPHARMQTPSSHLPHPILRVESCGCTITLSAYPAGDCGGGGSASGTLALTGESKGSNCRRYASDGHRRQAATLCNCENTSSNVGERVLAVAEHCCRRGGARTR